VREQPVDAVLGDRELRVVVIVGVDRHAVREGGEARRHLEPTADHGAAFGRGAAERAQVAAHDVAGPGDRAREREPDAVEDRALAQMRHLRGNVGGAGAGDEIGDVRGERFFAAV